MFYIFFSSEPGGEDANRSLTCPRPLPRKRPRFPSCYTDDLQSEDTESKPVNRSEIKKNPITADDKKRGEDGLPSYLKVTLCDRPVPDGDWGDHGPFRNLLECSMRSERKKLRRLKKHMRLIMTENRPHCPLLPWSLGTGLSDEITTQLYV